VGDPYLSPRRNLLLKITASRANSTSTVCPDRKCESRKLDTQFTIPSLGASAARYGISNPNEQARLAAQRVKEINEL